MDDNFQKCEGQNSFPVKKYLAISAPPIENTPMYAIVTPQQKLLIFLDADNASS